MSADQNKLLEEIKALAEKTSSKVTDIETLLSGDWRDPGKVGMVHAFFRMNDDIYNKKTGLLIRVGSLEITEKKAVAWGAGAAFVVCGVFSFIFFIVPIIIAKL